MKALQITSILAIAFLAVGCTVEQRCEFYEGVHARKIVEANGDQKKINLLNILYAPLKAGCAAQGVIIN